MRYREYSEEDRLRAQRRWLRGESTGRYALALHFAHASQPLDAGLVPGTALDAELAFFPGAAPLRLRVMGSLARVLAWHGLDLPRARALAAEAVTQARAAGDVPVLAACLLAQHNALWAPGTAGERRAVAAEVIALAGPDR